MSSDTSQEEHELIALRKAKLDRIRAEGAAFPNDFRRTHLSDALHFEHGDSTKEFFG
jgi:lysyl-tRNA synthetase class 2